MRKRTSSRLAGRYHQARRTTRPAAAGVSPPWLGEPNAVPGESSIVQRLANRRPGAADVSPPWVWKHVCVDTSAIVRKTADGECRPPLHSRAAVPRGLTLPALVYRRPLTGAGGHHRRVGRFTAWPAALSSVSRHLRELCGRLLALWDRLPGA